MPRGYIVVMIHPSNLERKVVEADGESKEDAKFAIEARYPKWKVITVKEVIEDEDEISAP